MGIPVRWCGNLTSATVTLTSVPAFVVVHYLLIVGMNL